MTLSERAPSRTSNPKIVIDLYPHRVSILADNMDQQREAEPLAVMLLALLNLLERERKAAA